MVVEAVAPARIDLAGGTLDIYPLYLFEEGGITVNIGVDVGGRAVIRTRPDRRVTLRSIDTGVEESADSLDDLTLGGPLDLCARILRFYGASTGLDVEVESRAPKGSGLGASSSLLIALSGAVNRLNGSPFTAEQIVRFGADLEAQNIRIPTGKQDYYPATFGGVNAIWFEVAGDRVEPLLVDEAAVSTLEDRLLLSFTGISHFSGATNWDMLRNYIEGRGETRAKMAAIKETALAMRSALLANDFTAFAEVLNEEWRNRRGLAEGVSTPAIDAMISAAAGAGALASKLCGAGGGGCMITFVQPGRQDQVAAALAAHGARRIPYRIAREGLQITVSDA